MGRLTSLALILGAMKPNANTGNKELMANRFSLVNLAAPLLVMPIYYASLKKVNAYI